MKTKDTAEILTTDLRKTLKGMMLNEIKHLPAMLEKLEPEHRLNMLIKLMPFILPKVENVSHEQGEPSEFEIKSWH